MAGRVLQVNVAPAGGVPKRPVPRARVTHLGLEGDRQKDTEHHGGPTQAVLVIAREWLDTLTKEGFDVFPGALGENLTVEGVDLHEYPPGARLQAGTTVLRVTKARAPCRTIAHVGDGIQKRIYNRDVKAGDATDPLWGAAGLYCAVDAEGDVAAGDAVTPA